MSDPPFDRSLLADSSLSEDQRIDALLNCLTLDEKVGQMMHHAPAIERLGIPAYNWWNEALHGVARAGVATVFPQAIALAASFDTALLDRVAKAIGMEGLAKHRDFVRHGDRGLFKGLTFWSPNVNVFRDPRWGRGHETFGECPFLTGCMGLAYCTGLQGDDVDHPRVAATPKHFAAHSGPEACRHGFNAEVSIKDLRETYLPAFRRCIIEGRAMSIMGAYNRLNGEHCCAHPWLLGQVLRDEWHFDGYVVSDCGAIDDICGDHQLADTPAQAAADAVDAGCDLNCGETYEHLIEAVEQGYLSEADIERSVRRLLRARLRLGLLGIDRSTDRRPDINCVDSEEHQSLALEAGRRSIVLLKNDGVLPLPQPIRTIGVIGPNAADTAVLCGNYHGTPSDPISVLRGIRETASSQTRVLYSEGCDIIGRNASDQFPPHNLIAEAVGIAERSDVVIAVVGLNATIEGEQGDATNADAGGDRKDLRLPGLQPELLEAVYATGKPLVVIVLSGSATDLRWADRHAGALIQAFYPGQAGGKAVAEVLLGKTNPAGRLPVTFPRSVDDLPPFGSYAMQGRTYRYCDAEPLYPFGFGLSFTQFTYADLSVSNKHLPIGRQLEVRATVTNVGQRSGDEVAQLYLSMEASFPTPRYDLRGFKRLQISAGQSCEVTFMLSPRDLSVVDQQGRRFVQPGRVRLAVGGGQPDPRSQQLLGAACLQTMVELHGEPVRLDP
jgi:beta-glucosidase